MKISRLALAAIALLGLGGVYAIAAGGVGLVTTPPAGSVVALDTTSPTNVGITVENLAAWIGSGGSQGNSVIGTGVNKVSLAGAATGVAPVITTGGASSDTNIGIVLAGKGTGLVHLGGSTIANGSVRIPTVASAVNAVTLSGAATGGTAFVTVGGTTSDTDAALGVYSKGAGLLLLGDSTSTLAGLQVAKTASAVNGLLVTPGATGTRVALSAATAGADANVGISIAGAGTGSILIGGGTTTLAGLQVAQTASRVNSIIVTPSATGTVPSIGVGGAGADATRNLSLLGAGANGIVVLGPAAATCSGTTTATCQGQRFVASVTGLSTAAAGTTSAAMTVTNASVVSSATMVHCQVNGYAGTGIPLVSTIIPGTGSVSFTITNVAASGALNATVPVACFVFG